MAPAPHVRIRPATIADADQLARLNVSVWRDTYGQIAPPVAYRMLDEARRLPYWRGTLTSGDPATGAIVAEPSDDILGVISHGPPGQPALEAAIEIKHLYVLPAAHGAGIGARLLRAAFDRFRALGLPDVALAVVHENVAARSFYATMGGTECGTFIDAGPLWRSVNVIVRWHLPR